MRRQASGAWAPIPCANGGSLLHDLQMPDFRDYAVPVAEARRRGCRSDPRAGTISARCVETELDTNFRVFGPDETASNRWTAVFEVTDRCSTERFLPTDEHVAHDGRVMEILSEHLCQGWLEGYLLTGRHGFSHCYEAFIHIVDSMFNQHAKWLKTSREIPWRRPIASLNYLLTSHVWRQDHNGFSHQDPGFIDHVVNKKAEVIRVYLPPDANTLLVRDRPLFAQPQLRECDGCGQTAGAAMAGHGRRHPALHGRNRDLGMGEQRPRQRARCRDGLLRRCADDGNAGGGGYSAQSPFPI